MTVKIYKEYNFDDFKEFIKENVKKSVDFIEENDLWGVLFFVLATPSYQAHGDHKKDDIIAFLGDMNYLVRLLED